MKKTILYAIMMMLVLALGVAYAEAASNFGSNEAIPNTNYDIGPADVPATLVEGANAGVIQSAGLGMELTNGVTDFSGKSYESLEDISVASLGEKQSATAEGSHAGGLRSVEPGVGSFNGVTDFTGRSYDIL